MSWKHLWLRRGLLIAATALLTALTLWALASRRGPSLRVWHRFHPNELHHAELTTADWSSYLQREEAVFQSVEKEVVHRLENEDRVPYNRYFEGSPLRAPRSGQDWNRSYVLEPDGPARGAVVLLHGMTDSPYSLRHVAAFYREQGFVAVGVRLPGHGTVPGGLESVQWEDWLAAARIGFREARRRVGEGRPLQVVGYSTGAALAVKHTLDLAPGDPLRPDRLVLLSPMIGVTEFARFAGIASLPAMFPAFAKSAWVSLQPEYNPFKYNSFPVNGAKQSYRLSRTVQDEVSRASRNGVLARFPPVLAFCSVVDSTVSVPAVVTGLFDHLPDNGSELVVFGLNQNVDLGPLLRPGVATAMGQLLPSGARRYGVSWISNSPGRMDVMESRTPAGGGSPTARDLGLAFPPGLFSLSHVAIPFPVTDGLYGLEPSPADNFGVRLGRMSVRGELGVLVVPLESWLRIGCNPFFPYVLQRVGEGMTK